MCILTAGYLYYWTSTPDWFTCCTANLTWSSFACMYPSLLLYFAVYHWKTESSVCVCVCVCTLPSTVIGLSPSQIGHQDRKAGPYGACFSAEADNIFVARPGLRLWKAQASSGTVTKRFFCNFTSNVVVPGHINIKVPRSTGISFHSYHPFTWG